MPEGNPDIQIVVNPKVKTDRFFIHVARQFPNEASADAHLVHMKRLTAVEGSHLTVIEANISGKWVVVLSEEPNYGREADRKLAVAGHRKAGLPLELAPSEARKLVELIIEAGL